MDDVFSAGNVFGREREAVVEFVLRMSPASPMPMMTAMPVFASESLFDRASRGPVPARLAKCAGELHADHQIPSRQPETPARLQRRRMWANITGNQRTEQHFWRPFAGI